MVQQLRVLLVLGSVMNEAGGFGAPWLLLLFVPGFMTLREKPRRPEYDTCSRPCTMFSSAVLASRLYVDLLCFASSDCTLSHPEAFQLMLSLVLVHQCVYSLSRT